MRRWGPRYATWAALPWVSLFACAKRTHVEQSVACDGGAVCLVLPDVDADIPAEVLDDGAAAAGDAASPDGEVGQDAIAAEPDGGLGASDGEASAAGSPSDAGIGDGEVPERAGDTPSDGGPACADGAAVCESACAVGELSCAGHCVAPFGDAATPGCPSAVARFDHPTALGCDDDDVYVGTWNELLRVAAATGDREPIAGLELPVRSLAFSGDSVVVGGVSGLFVVPKAGGALTLVALPEVTSVSSVSADDTHAYYVTNFNIVRRVALTGGAPELVSTGPFNSNVVDLVRVGGELFFANSGTLRADLVTLLAETAYIATAAVDAGTRTTVVERLVESPNQLVSDGEHVYWTDSALRSVAVEGGDVTTLSTGLEGPVTELVVDDRNFYWATSHAVYALSRAGGEPRVLVRGFQQLVGMCQSEGTLYLLDARAGALFALPK